MYMAKYWSGEILANLSNDSQFAPNQNLPLKYFECRAEVIRQFITAKSLVSIYWPKFHHPNISPCMVSHY